MCPNEIAADPQNSGRAANHTAETCAARFASYNSNGKMKLMNMVKPRKYPAL
jgi:hypothetical protein